MRNLLFAFLWLGFFSKSPAQPTLAKLKITVLSSLYLDTLYKDALAKKLNITEFENYLKLGWDFYLGFKTAVDSLSQTSFAKPFSHQLEFQYYDIRKIVQENSQELSPEFMKANHDIILGIPLKNQIATLAKFANDRKIPFISALYPNLVNEKNYPSHIVLNPLLTTHINEMIKHIYKTNDKKKIKVMVKANEDNVIILEALTKLKNSYWSQKNIIEIIPLYDSFFIYKTDALHLLPNELSSIFVLSLDKDFTERLWQQIGNKYNPKEYNFFIGGMPNWEQEKTIDSSQWPHLTFCYSKSFFYDKKDATILKMTNEYKEKFNSEPSDMYWLAYQSTLTFTKKLIQHPNNFAFLKYINDTTEKTFFPFVFYSKDALYNINKPTNEFIENQHLFFIESKLGIQKIVEN